MASDRRMLHNGRRTTIGLHERISCWSCDFIGVSSSSRTPRSQLRQSTDGSTETDRTVGWSEASDVGAVTIHTASLGPNPVESRPLQRRSGRSTAAVWPWPCTIRSERGCASYSWRSQIRPPDVTSAGSICIGYGYRTVSIGAPWKKILGIQIVVLGRLTYHPFTPFSALPTLRSVFFLAPPSSLFMFPSAFCCKAAPNPAEGSGECSELP